MGVLNCLKLYFNGFLNDIDKATFFDNLLKNSQNIGYMTVLNLLYRFLTTQLLRNRCLIR